MGWDRGTRGDGKGEEEREGEGKEGSQSHPPPIKILDPSLKPERRTPSRRMNFVLSQPSAYMDFCFD